MPTVNEIKAELDARGIEYPSSGVLKADLEALLGAATLNNADVPHEDRPRNIKHERPDYIDPEDDFVEVKTDSNGFHDPNWDNE
jgi:hypothetical protein